MSLETMFPKTIFVKNWQEKYGVDKAFNKQLTVVCGEAMEAQEAYARGDIEHTQEEIIDMLHSAVQLIYMLPATDMNIIEKRLAEVRKKNEERGYYAED